MQGLPHRTRVVVGGFIGLLPAGGVTWDYIQYPVGLAELGCDVYYIEDTRLWPVYQSSQNGEADCHSNVAYLKHVMEAFGLGDRWAYRDEASGECFGLSLERVREICASAEVFLNISCSTFLRDEYLAIPGRALIDSDPMFTQIQYATQQTFTSGESSLRSMINAHTHLFTFGENIGQPDCRIPAGGHRWIPTRQPVCLEHWPETPQPPLSESSYTTLMNWTAGKPLVFEGETWGQKDVEFRRFMSLPRCVPGISLAVAVGQTTGAPFPSGDAEAAGWTVLDPSQCAPDTGSYRSFLQKSRGEFSVAKETYVKAHTGWFSCRSACYLASGRPVIAQDTGWSRIFPTERGLFPFEDFAAAAEALRAAEADPVLHSKAARNIAREFFDSRHVLAGLLKEIGV